MNWTYIHSLKSQHSIWCWMSMGLNNITINIVPLFWNFTERYYGAPYKLSSTTLTPQGFWLYSCGHFCHIHIISSFTKMQMYTHTAVWVYQSININKPILSPLGNVNILIKRANSRNYKVATWHHCTSIRLPHSVLFCFVNSYLYKNKRS